MELPLRYQDAWLEDIRAKGIWKPEVEDIECPKALNTLKTM